MRRRVRRVFPVSVPERRMKLGGPSKGRGDRSLKCSGQKDPDRSVERTGTGDCGGKNCRFFKHLLFSHSYHRDPGARKVEGMLVPGDLPSPQQKLIPVALKFKHRDSPVTCLCLKLSAPTNLE